MSIVRNTLAGVLVAASASAAHAQNLVTNGGFEAGLTGWSNTSCTMSVDSFSAPEGSSAAGTGCIRSDPSVISQDIATVVGDTYTLTFYGGTSTGGDLRNYIKASFGGNEVFNSAITAANNGSIEYSLFSAQTGPATSALTTLTFAIANDPGGEFLDGISVTQSVVATPEPASLALLATGLAGIGFIRRRPTQSK